jgi:hypothetical protein
MRILLAAVAAALALAPAADAATPIERWAKTHNLKGKWKAKDADRDGVKNRREFTLDTHPRKADSDRDRLRDGDELKLGTNPRVRDSDRAKNAGYIRDYDGATVTIDRFIGGRVPAAGDAHWAEEDEPVEEEEETVIDLGGDDDYGAGACTDPTLAPGGLVTSAVIDADGVALDIKVKSSK